MTIEPIGDAFIPKGYIELKDMRVYTNGKNVVLTGEAPSEEEELRKSNAREVEQFSDGYKAAKDGLSENDEPTGYEINEDQWRVGYAWGMYDKLRADAKDSQEWNTDVIMPLIDQLRAAGYTGTLSEMVGQACEAREATRWIPVGERLPETKQDILVIVKYKKPRVEKACYIPPKTILAEDFLSDDCDCESVQEYDEENDSYWVVEGWWESSWESDANWKLSGEVTHWMPLPVPPKGGE